MARISEFTPPGINTLDVGQSTGVEFIRGTQTAATGTWTGVSKDQELYDGKQIIFFLPFAGDGNATLNLTMGSGAGAATGAKDVYFSSTTRMAKQFSANQQIHLIYHKAMDIGGTVYEGWWHPADYYVSNTNTIGEYAGACTAGPNGMARYSLIMQVSENRWESLVLSSSTATSKAKNTSGFLVNSPLLYQNTGTYASGVNAAQTACWSTAYNADSRYSFNVSTSWSAAGRPLFLVGTISNGLFYLNGTKWWADALPTSADGLYYRYVGQMANAYQYTLHPVNPFFYHDGSAIREYRIGVAEEVAWNNVTGKPSTYPPSSHNHDDRYYTESEIDAKIAALPVEGHNHDDRYYTETEIDTKLSKKADLDSNGKVPESQLPSYVDDVLEYTAKSKFPTTGEAGKIYVDTTTNLTYRWSGSAYIEVSPSIAIGETSSTAYRGDYGAAAYKHAVTNKGSAFASGLYKITTNAEGHVTGATAVTKDDITALGIPGSDTNTDTKVTNTLATNKKAYITGAESATTNTGTQVFDTGVYLTTTPGELNATQYKLNEKAQMVWNNTNQCIDFVFT